MRGKISRNFLLDDLEGRSVRKTALLIAPPVYDTQYWAEWSQPYGLLRIAALLKKRKYKKLWLFDFMEADEEREVRSHRINAEEQYIEKDRPDGPTVPISIEK